MPPPVARESYVAAFINLRQVLTAAKESQDPQQAILKAFQAIEASAEISENIVRSIGAVEDKLENWESAAPFSPQISYAQKPLSESKCISNLKCLGSDKAEFKA